MKEYTVLAIISVILTILLDYKLKTNLFRRRLFYLFLAIIFVFKLAVNGFLTAKNIFIYNPKAILGLRIGTIPLEDFLFAFSMVTVSIILWEYFKGRRA